MKNVTSDATRDRISDERFLDTRHVQLDHLAADPAVQRMVTRLLKDMDAPARVQVAAFNAGLL